MLEGKPTRQDDAVTMRAIKDILCDYEGDLTHHAEMPYTSDQRNPARESGPDLTLTPVKAVDTKVRPAVFTTVPSGDVPEASVEIIRTRAPDVGPAPQKERAKETLSSKNPRTKRSAAKTRPRRKMALSRLKVPSVLCRFSPRWGAIAVLFACAILYPALIVLPIFATLFVVIGAFVLFGSERVWDRVGQGLARLETRSPRKTARLMARLDAFAVRWDAILDRFPEGWVDGLYLPDFANSHERSRYEDALVTARLQRMHRQV